MPPAADSPTADLAPPVRKARRPLPDWVFWTLAVVLIPVIFFTFGVALGFYNAATEHGDGAVRYLAFTPAALLSLCWLAVIARGVLGVKRLSSAQRWPGAQVMVVTVIVASLMGGVIGLLTALLRMPLVEALLRAGFFAILFAFVLVYWRRIDEAAREAQKTAWLWGSVIGVAVAGAAEPVLFSADGAPRLPSLGDGSPHDWMLTGAAYLFLAQCAVATVLWGVWWIRAR